MSNYRFLLADDQPIVRLALKKLFQNTMPDVTCDEAGSGETVLSLLTTNSYEILVLDICMPGVGGVEFFKKLNSKLDACKVVVFSGYDELLYGLHFLRAGAMSYVPKSGPVDKLLKAVMFALQGRRFLSRVLTDKMETALLSGNVHSGLEMLSPRESHILHMILNGTTNKDIANDLNIAASTISTYRKRIMAKLGASDEFQLREIVRIMTS